MGAVRITPCRKQVLKPGVSWLLPLASLQPLLRLGACEAVKERNLNKTTKLFPSRSFKLTMQFRVLFNRQPEADRQF